MVYTYVWLGLFFFEAKIFILSYFDLQIIAKRVKQDMYRPPSNDKVIPLAQEFDVDGTGFILWSKFEVVIKDIMPDLTEG